MQEDPHSPPHPGEPRCHAGSPGKSTVKRRVRKGRQPGLTGEQTDPAMSSGPTGHPRGPGPPAPCARPGRLALSPTHPRSPAQSSRLSTGLRNRAGWSARQAAAPTGEVQARAVCPGAAEHTETLCFVRQPQPAGSPGGPSCLPGFPPGPSTAAAAWPPEAGPRGHACPGRPAALLHLGTGPSPTRPRERGQGRDASGFASATAPPLRQDHYPLRSPPEAVAPPLGAQLPSHPSQEGPSRLIPGPTAPPQAPSGPRQTHTAAETPLDLRAQPTAASLMRPSLTAPGRVTPARGVFGTRRRC